MDNSKYHDVLWSFHAEDGRDLVRVTEFRHTVDSFYQSESNFNFVYEFRVPLSELDAGEGREIRWAKKRISQSTVKRVGLTLWSCLPSHLTSSLQALLGNVNRPVRLRISGDSALINDLPWEWLTPPDGVAMAVRKDARLCRYLPVLMQAPAMTVDLPVRILVVVTNPKDERLLNASQEINIVVGKIPSDKFRIEFCYDPKIAAFAAQIEQVQPNIVHYIGHAGSSHGDGFLILHDSENFTHWVSPLTISNLLPKSVRLVCLSTCVTAPNYQMLGLLRLAFSDVQLEIPTAIANQYPLSAESVSDFWTAFYQALIDCNGETTEAVLRARLAIRSQGQDFCDWGSFAHVLRNTNGQVFRLRRSQSIEQEEAEIKARFATQIANNLAEYVRKLGSRASAELVELANRETTRARSLVEKLDH